MTVAFASHSQAMPSRAAALILKYSGTVLLLAGNARD
jgi:hypothetical protein